MTRSVPLGCVPRAWILAIQCHLYRACVHINHGSQPSRVNSQGILRPCLPVSASAGHAAAKDAAPLAHRSERISASAGHAAAKDAAPLAHRSERKCWLHVVRLLEGSYRDRLRRHILMQQQPSHEPSLGLNSGLNHPVGADTTAS